MTFDEMLEAEAPKHCEPVQNLWDWSRNCEHPTPAAVFADMIGVSEDMFGENISGGKFSRLGYLELSYLAEALEAYSNYPDQIRHYVRQILEAE